MLRNPERPVRRLGGMKRRLITAAGAGALLLATAACGQQQPDVGFGGQPPQQSGPAEPKPAQERSPVPESQRAPGAGDVWTQDGGTALGVIGQEGGCSRVHAEVADQNANQVTLALVEETPTPARMCTMDLRYPPVAVQLAEPLGERTVAVEHRDVQVPR